MNDKKYSDKLYNDYIIFTMFNKIITPDDVGKSLLEHLNVKSKITNTLNYMI